jgi:hypothetical protein
MYDDFKIKASDYSFLKNEDRYIACSNILFFDIQRIKEKVGTIKFGDMKTLIEKIRNSDVLDPIEKNSVLPELEEWLLDNS